MIRAHQPGSEPIDIPETIPNPVVVPKPTPTPTEPAPKEPVRIPGEGSLERRLNGRQLYVRRAVDSEGEVLDILVQPLGRTRVGRGVLCGSGRCPFRKSYPDVLVVQPGQDWDGDNDTGPLDPAAFEGSGLSMAHTAEFILHQFLHPSF